MVAEVCGNVFPKQTDLFCFDINYSLPQFSKVG